MKRPLATCLALGLLLLSFDAAAVGTRRIGLRNADDFKGGEMQGVAVDASGTVRAGFNLGKVEVMGASSVWSALALGRDQLLLATGHEGKLFEVKGGAVKEVGKAETMVLSSVVNAFGTVLVGSLPGATLYEFKNGKLTEWLKLGQETDHIFALAYDAKERALYAATGPEGKLFRITQDKKAQVFFDAEEQHLMSVATGNGKVYVGAGDKAKLYELSGPGRASVLYDFGSTEVRAIAVAANGDVYAIANEIKQRTFPSSKSGDKTKAAASGPKGKGTLYRFDKNGKPEQLLEDDDEHYTALALDAKGKPYVGTGAQGRLYTVDDQHNAVLVADTDERQISAVLLDGQERAIVSSDPVVVHPIRGVGGADALWTSKVIDLGLRARFGRLQWTSDGDVKLSTRTGNTQEPDDTWSSWSADMNASGEVKSPPARFIQVRARFGGPSATLSEVILPFVTDNLRAVITKIEAETASNKGLSAPDGKLQESGGPITADPEHEVELKWDVDNPDKDPLRYRLHYQLVGTNYWFDMLEPNQKLTKSSYDWDTRSLPEGQYRVRVSASDEIANPPEAATDHSLVSHVMLVDNTPPELKGLTAAGRRVKGTALDGVGPIARVEFALAGSDDWNVVVPTDGVYDETSEEFEFDASSVSASGPALISVRVFDSENNVVVRSLQLR